MGWEMSWYSVPAESHARLLAGRYFGMKSCYLREGDRVYETYWTTGRGVESMAPSYGILDMTVYGRQETWEDSPSGWPQPYEIRGQQFRVGHLARGPSAFRRAWPWLCSRPVGQRGGELRGGAS